jgi:hypothetical protein
MNTVFVLYIAIMKSPFRWSSEMDLALMKSMGQCLQQNNSNAKVVGNFRILLDSLCAAVDTIKSKETVHTDLNLNNSSRPDQHVNLTESVNSIALPQNGQLAMSMEKENNGMEDPGYRNVFPDANGEVGVSMSNFHFEDFFGNDLNTFNMQFWPMDFGPGGSLSNEQLG